MIELLSKPDLSDIQKALFELSEAEQIVAAMARAGLDCEEHDQRCKHYRGVLEGLKREFGAGLGAKGQTGK